MPSTSINSQPTESQTSQKRHPGDLTTIRPYSQLTLRGLCTKLTNDRKIKVRCLSCDKVFTVPEDTHFGTNTDHATSESLADGIASMPFGKGESTWPAITKIWVPRIITSEPGLSHTNESSYFIVKRDEKRIGKRSTYGMPVSRYDSAKDSNDGQNLLDRSILDLKEQMRPGFKGVVHTMKDSALKMRDTNRAVLLQPFRVESEADVIKEGKWVPGSAIEQGRIDGYEIDDFTQRVFEALKRSGTGTEASRA